VSRRPLLAQLARIGKDNLRLSLVIADLPGDAEPLAAQRDLGGPEFLAMIAVDDRRERLHLDEPSRSPIMSAVLAR
jgi:hypothetical protein